MRCSRRARVQLATLALSGVAQSVMGMLAALLPQAVLPEEVAGWGQEVRVLFKKQQRTETLTHQNTTQKFRSVLSTFVHVG